MLKDMVDARQLQGHRIHVRFDDRVEGDVDLAELVELTGVFAPLRDPEEVRKARVDPELETVCWPNGADGDPDVLYAHLSRRPIDLNEPPAVA